MAIIKRDLLRFMDAFNWAKEEKRYINFWLTNDKEELIEQTTGDIPFSVLIKLEIPNAIDIEYNGYTINVESLSMEYETVFDTTSYVFAGYCEQLEKECILFVDIFN